MNISEKFFFYEIYGEVKHINLVGDYMGLQLQTRRIKNIPSNEVLSTVKKRIYSDKSSQIVDGRFDGECLSTIDWEHNVPFYIEARYRNFNKAEKGEGLITVGEKAIACLHPGNSIKLLMKARLQKLPESDIRPYLASTHEVEFQIIEVANDRLPMAESLLRVVTYCLQKND